MEGYFKMNVHSRILTNFFYLFFIITFTVSCSDSTDKPSVDNRNTPPPNIVFIMADDLGWADLPTYGNEFNEAPNIETLAKQGMKFTNAYAASAVCSPTRASIMSGQYPARVGINDFIPGHWYPYEKLTVPVNRTQYLPLDITTIAEAMKGAGYETGYFGKWHLGNLMEHHPLNHGFDKAKIAKGRFYNIEFKPSDPTEPNSKRFSEKITDFGIDFIQENKKQPFFLFLSHYDVHVQLNADQDLIDKYLQKKKTDENYPSNAVYAAMIEHLDKSVGKITGKLQELGLSENTIVIFYSDNGGLRKRFDKVPLIAKGKRQIYRNDSLLYIATSNKPLRGQKGNLYEGGIREPLIVKWPNKINPGSVSNMLVSSIDFYPTLLDIAEAELPEQQVFDGKSILPALRGKEDGPNRPLYWHYPVYHHGEPASAIRKGDWKLIQFLDDNEVELYNLANDIKESKNLVDQNPQKVEELKELLINWRENVGAEMPKSNPKFDPKRRGETGTHPHLKDMIKHKLRAPQGNSK